MTTSHLPTASVVLAVGVDLMTDLVSQRGHVSTKALRSDLGTRHLEVATKPDLSGRTSWRRQSRRTADLRLIATNSQIRGQGCPRAGDPLDTPSAPRTTQKNTDRTHSVPLHSPTGQFFSTVNRTPHRAHATRTDGGPTLTPHPTDWSGGPANTTTARPTAAAARSRARREVADFRPICRISRRARDAFA